MTNANQKSALTGSRLGTARVRASDMAELIRRGCQAAARQGFRVLSDDVRGYIFFEHGRVIHAEFGEDCGLRAVVEMLRAGHVVVEPWTLHWPSQPSLHLGPELLLSMTEQDGGGEPARLDTRVIRKVVPRVDPPSLPEPQMWVSISSPAAVSSTVSPTVSSTVSPTVSSAPPSGSRRTPPSGSRRTPPSGSRRTPSSSLSAGPAIKADETAPDSRPQQGLLAARVAETLAQARRVSAAGAASPSSSAAPRREVTVAAEPDLPPSLRAAPGRAIRAAKPRARAVVVSPRTLPAEPSSEVGRRPVSQVVPARAAAMSEPGGENQPTTMVRLAACGTILAARGKNSERLADAAAFIHGVANLIAADLGRHGRANVHLRGGGSSLLVVRSEVNDIAAALGPTRRLASLLRKVGL